MNRLEQYDVYSIPTASIYFDADFNCRREFTLHSIQQLAESIRDDGLKFPIVIQPACDAPNIPPGFAYRLVIGHRRFRSVTSHLGWTEIASQIIAGMSEKQAGIFNLIENIERKDLNVLEEAQAMMVRFPESTDREIADELHKYPMWVCRRKILLRQPAEIQKMAASGRLTVELIQDRIHPLKTKAEKIKLARSLVEGSSPRVKQAARDYRMMNRPRTRSEINAKIAYMLELGLHDQLPILTRFAAWCARGVRDEEIDRDLADLANHRQK